MDEHLVLCVDHLVTPESLPLLQGQEVVEFPGESSSTSHADPSTSVISIKENEEKRVADEVDPLIESVECRICQEEDSVKNLEIPCVCSGSLKYAHRNCVQRWCNEKGDIICEICHQPYQHGYTASPRLLPDNSAIEISEGWTIAGTPVDLQDPRLLAIAGSERHLLEADYDEYADSSASGAAFCRFATLILMALLLLRHTITIGNDDSDKDDDDIFTFSLILLRVMGLLLPCYIVAWAMSILQRRRQRQEAAALSTNEVAFMLQAGQHRGLQVRIDPISAMTPAPESTSEPSRTPRPEPV
ncbi:membrane associated ring finger 1,8 [Olea europaea subsp. europaea]|uniref:Membrane associated ring finger 1,8 n=1 Tax=Olea europaea subsp. europaea TaxID=158383 RepID=A0A8S0Q7C8_OLEEU|nr:membrane associated ring finger 1,8 [Olea europaea subsp. europaea]